MPLAPPVTTTTLPVTCIVHPVFSLLRRKHSQRLAENANGQEKSRRQSEPPDRANAAPDGKLREAIQLPIAMTNAAGRLIRARGDALGSRHAQVKTCSVLKTRSSTAV